jgi:hypothetical protein
MMRRITRREFLNKSILGLGAFGISELIGGCAPQTASDTPIPATNVPTATTQTNATSAPTATSQTIATNVPTATSQTIATNVPTATNQAIAPSAPTATRAPTIPPDPRRAALMAHWPAAETSRVVKVHHSGAWAGADTAQQTVIKMLDAGLISLTGVADELSAWQALFNAGDRVLLKVNCIDSGLPTPPVVTYAVAQRLIDAGLSPENILIFDRTDRELQASGYKLNESGPGIRCHGALGAGTEAALSQATVRFFQEFDECDAVINLPLPRSHPFAGITVALKNHYGSVNQPMSLHGNSCEAAADLNAQPILRDKTRLIVGSALQVASGNWRNPETEDSLLLSFDPVAHDTVARDILVRYRQAQGQDSGSLINISRYLQKAQSLNLGTNDPTKIELIEKTLA